MATFLIDISNHQGTTFKPAQAIREGYPAVWAKATEGTTFKDPRFLDFTAETISAGGLPGAYHYLRSGSGRTQAEAFHTRVVAAGGPAGFMVACDNEADATWDTTTGFFARWNDLTANYPMAMYSGNWWWTSRGWNGSSLTPLLWDSRYVSGNGYGSDLYGKVPDTWWKPRYGGWGSATLLQFTSSATVAGQKIDVSAFRGTVEELRVLLTTPAAPPVSSHPAWPGRVLTYRTGASMMRGTDVTTWQRQMATRGWRITADGWYGTASLTVCRKFQAEKHLTVDGMVGRVTWDASWSTPIT